MFQVVTADWTRDNTTIRHIRIQVFTEEQKVPFELDLDGRDPISTHVLAYQEGVAVGTGRVQRDGKIGRMAVLAEARGKGCGGAMLERLLALAGEQGTAGTYLDAQEAAIGFYERFGFMVEGERFDDGGIPHRRMVRRPERIGRLNP